MADTQLLPEEDKQAAGQDGIARTPEEQEDLINAPSYGEDVDVEAGIQAAENHANQKSASVQSILRKKKGWVFGGGIAGLILAAIFGLLSLLPLKLEHLIKNIMASQFDRVEYAMERRAEKYFEAFVTRRIMPVKCAQQEGVGNSKCTGLGNLATGYLAKDLFDAWEAGRFEERLARNQGIVFGYQKGQARPFTVSVKGETIGFDREFKFADMPTPESRGVIRTAVKNETKWYQVYKRRHLRTLLMRKYGVKNWRLFEDKRDKYDEKVFNAKKALKLELVDRVVKPIAPRYAAYFTCIVEGCNLNDPNDPVGKQITVDQDLNVSDQPGNPQTIDASLDIAADDSLGDTDTDNDTRAKLEADRARARNGGASDAVNAAADQVTQELTEAGADQADDLVGKQVIERIQSIMANKIVQSVGVGIGVMEVISKVDKALTNGTISKIVEDKNKLQLANQFSAYATLADQLKAGKLQPAEVAAVMENLDGVEKSRVYGTLFGTQVDPALEECDGKQLASNESVCPALHVKQPVWIEEVWESNPVFKVIHEIASAYRRATSGIMGVIGWVTSTISDAILTPIIQPIMNALGIPEKIESVFNGVMSHFFGPVLSGNEVGKDLFNAVYGGADVSANSFAQYGLAGRILTPAEIEQLSYQSKLLKDETNATQSTFTRYASLDNEKSLASRMLAVLPFSSRGMANAALASIGSPFSPHSSWFGGILSRLTASASAITATCPANRSSGECDPFRIDQYGYTDVELSQGIDMTEAQCAQMDQQWTSDRVANNGVSKITNVCRLDKVMVESAKSELTNEDDGGVGGLISATNPYTTAPSETAQPISASRAEMNQRLLSNPLFAGSTANAKNDITNGIASDKIVSVLLQLVEQLKVSVRVSVIKAGHTPCSASGRTSNHYSGLAADIGNEEQAGSIMPFLYNNRGNMDLNELIYATPPSGTKNLFGGEDHSYNRSTLDGHIDHIHVSVSGEKQYAGCPNDPTRLGDAN